MYSTALAEGVWPEGAAQWRGRQGGATCHVIIVYITLHHSMMASASDVWLLPCSRHNAIMAATAAEAEAQPAATALSCQLNGW
jgi:hypothetical protein